MSDRFYPLSAEQLVDWIADELEAADSIFGIPRRLFFTPAADDPFKLSLYGVPLETPIGVAAGPHSQLAQNILVSWLCGGRVIELKTVQTLDEIEVSKPCIDMQDEGYNVEWSQELTVRQSFEEYLRAWVLTWVLHHRLGLPGERPGVLFNISVGYDLEGIKKPNMRWFLERMEDAGEAFDRTVELVARRFPEVRSLPIPRRMSDNVTLSTMHGCPPDEIGRIAGHLMEEWGLHTSVKLNPTLLGPEEVRHVLLERLGFRQVTVPDAAFEHDLEFRQAIDLIGHLEGVAERCGLTFGLKLCNTLEVVNHRPVFTADEKMMYLSGRPLLALVVRLAHRLVGALDRRPLMSFAGGVDAFNVAELLAAGMRTVTTCSDLLRPGGYLRLLQYLDNVDTAVRDTGASDLESFIHSRGGTDDTVAAANRNLARYAEKVLEDPELSRDRFDRAVTKTDRSLGAFDCIVAPCTDGCAVDQQVPEYMRRVRQGDIEGAIAVTREDNPLAAITGRACDHPCEPVCLRNHLDEPLAIREIKRYIVEHEGAEAPPAPPARPGPRTAIIGGGPCGLAAATFLAREGLPVTIFEAMEAGGGQVSGTIPVFRTPQSAIDQDVRLVQALGVETRYGRQAGRDFTLQSLRDEGCSYIAVAIGAQVGKRLGIPGDDAEGVREGLDFLRDSRAGAIGELSGAVAVIGGGDVAMDCARSALRLGASEVTVLYRRTREEMPAQREELAGVLEEGIAFVELVTPQAVVIGAGRMTALECIRNRLGEPDASGRRRPEPIAGSEFRVPAGTLLVAIGQKADLALFGGEQVTLADSGYIEVDPETLETSIPGVFAGGDIAGAGPSSIVAAAGDGRRIAAAILAREGLAPVPRPEERPEVDVVDLLARRARREHRTEIPHLPVLDRQGFVEVVQTFGDEAAVAEASRCVDCDLMCSTCDGVCPNRAIFSYRSARLELRLPVVEIEGEAATTTPGELFEVAQKFQVAVITDLCNECGNCTTFCPAAGRPYVDKPRLYLNREEFEEQDDNAFMLYRRGELWGARGRFGGEQHEIVLDRSLHYLSPTAALILDPDLLTLQRAAATRPENGPVTVTLEHCFTLYALLDGVRSSMPWLPVATVD